MITNIIIVAYTNFPYGGASANYLRNMSKGLVENGCNVEVLLPTGNYFGNKLETTNLRRGIIEGVAFRHFCFKNHPRNIIGKIIDNIIGPIHLVYYIAKLKLRNKVDILIKYNITFGSNTLFKLVTKLFGIKFINVLPEYFEKPLKLNLSLLKWYNFYFGISIMSKYADGIIVLSTFLKNYLIREKKFKNPTFLMPNLVDSELFNFPQNKERVNKDIIIGYTGTPTKKDGILDLFESFSLVIQRYPTTKLLIIGDITNGDTIIPQLIEEAKMFGIEENVSFTGLVKFNKIPVLLNSCDILVLTRPNSINAEAGFPTKLGEYFASRRPVVITKVGDINNYFKNTSNVILVEPGNPIDIANGIQLLIGNENKRHEIVDFGYNWMLENLEYKFSTKKLLAWLNVVINKK